MVLITAFLIICMTYPGFEVSDNIVGKKISFDTIRLESTKPINKRIEDDIPAKLTITDDSRDEVINLIEDYFERNPEIEYFMAGSSESFRFVALDPDVEPLLDMLVNKIVLRISPMTFGKGDHGEIKVDLLEIIDEDFDYCVGNPSWDRLTEAEIDVEEIIKDQIPDGPDSTSITKERYRDFIFDLIAPITRNSNWPEGAAWSINLALHELRNGRYEEAAYAFDAVRNSITKSPNPVDDTEITELLNKYLISLRDLSLYQSSTEYNVSKQELFHSISEREYIFLPIFQSEPDYYDKNFRMSSSVWIANALIFVASVGTALGAPTISRAEVDPFGSDMTFRNQSFVLRTAQNLLEIHDGSTETEEIEHLNYIDFEKFAPEVILRNTFTSLGYANIELVDDSVVYQDKKYNFSPDLALSKDERLHLVYYCHRNKVDLIHDVDSLDENIKLIFVSDGVFDDHILEIASDFSFVELYYLDVAEETIRTTDSGLPVRDSPPITKDGVQDRLCELFNAAGDCEDTNEKGDLLEELCKILFDRYIDDTEVIRMNAETDMEEIDLVLRNKQEGSPWRELSKIIMVECKNWSKPAGASVVRDFHGKAGSLGSQCSTGILICWNGITGEDNRDAARGTIRDKKRDGFEILHFDSDEIKEAIESENPNSVFDDRYIEMISEF